MVETNRRPGERSHLPDAFYRREITKPTVLFTPTQLDFVFNIGRGKTAPEIARENNISPFRVINVLKTARDSIGAYSTMQALDYALSTGQIDKDALTEGFDFNRYHALSPKEKALAAIMADPDNSDRGSKQVAALTNKTEAVVRTQIGNIIEKLGVKNHVQVRLFARYLPEEVKQSPPDPMGNFDLNKIHELSKIPRWIIENLTYQYPNLDTELIMKDLGYTDKVAYRVQISRTLRVLGLKDFAELRSFLRQLRSTRNYDI